VAVPAANDKGGEGYKTYVFGEDARRTIDQRIQDHPNGRLFPEVKSATQAYHYFERLYKSSKKLDDVVAMGAFNHTFRHTFACNRVEQGMSIHDLMKFMGHHDVKVTMVYAKHSEDAIWRAIRQCEPESSPRPRMAV
jgi:integrase